MTDQNASSPADEAGADAQKDASATVKLDAAALRKLVVATVLTVEDEPVSDAAPAAPPPEPTNS